MQYYSVVHYALCIIMHYISTLVNGEETSLYCIEILYSTMLCRAMLYYTVPSNVLLTILHYTFSVVNGDDRGFTILNSTLLHCYAVPYYAIVFCATLC